MNNLTNYILEHLTIVLIATAIAVVIGILLGVIAYWVKWRRPAKLPI